MKMVAAVGRYLDVNELLTGGQTRELLYCLWGHQVADRQIGFTTMWGAAMVNPSQAGPLNKTFPWLPLMNTNLPATFLH